MASTLAIGGERVSGAAIREQNGNRIQINPNEYE